MSVFQNAVKKTAAFSIAAIAVRVLSVALLPIYTRALTPRDYGILELLDFTLNVVAALFGVQLSTALFYYYARACPEDRRRVLGTAAAGSLFIGIVAATLGIANAGWLSTMVFRSTLYVPALRLYFASLAISPFVDTAFGTLRLTDRIATWTWGAMARQLLMAVLNIVFLLLFRWGYYSILWSSIVANGVFAVWLAVDLYRRRHIGFHVRLFAGMIRYSAPLTLASVGMLMVHYGDRFFLQRYVSLTDIGIYSLAYKIGMFVTNIHTPFLNYWSIDMFSVSRRADGPSVYVRMFTYFAFAMAGGGALLVLFSRPLIAILAAPAYANAARYVPWLVLAYVLRSIGEHLRTPLLTEARTGANTKVTAIGVLACLIAYAVLIPKYGVGGAVTATVLAFAVMGFYAVYESQRVQPYRFEYARLGKLGLALLGPCIAYRFIHVGSVFEEFVVSIGLALLIPGLLWLSGFLTPSERNELGSLGARWRSAVTILPEVGR